MARSLFSSLSLSLLSLTIAACGAEPSDVEVASDAPEANEASSPRIEQGRTTTFSGTFDVPIAGGDPARFAFTVSAIDWTSGKAVWNAEVVAPGAAGDGATDDVDVPMTIAFARCPGCYSFGAASAGGGRLVDLDVHDTRVRSLRYAGSEVENLRVTAKPAAAARGACELVCGGRLEGCVDDVAEGDCNADLFDAIPRCPYTIELERGGRCAR